MFIYGSRLICYCKSASRSELTSGIRMIVRSAISYARCITNIPTARCAPPYGHTLMENLSAIYIAIIKGEKLKYIADDAIIDLAIFRC